MCGIAGAVHFSSNGSDLTAKIAAATQSMHQRGPDHQAAWQEGKVALGHARLSIIDTSAAAHQPFTDESGRYILVFNGEIYNFRTLRKELEKDGIHFKTDGDTEVLLHLYIKHGSGCLPLLNGFFAFAVYDQQEDRLFLARDRMGIKPLLYHWDKKGFAFASEMKALMQLDIPRRIDHDALFTYLQLNYIPAPATIFLNTFKLLPGHCITVVDEHVNVEAWYTIPKSVIPASERSYEEAQAQLRTLMQESVERRMIADVPLGSYLSGGIDSSVIATLACAQNPQLKTFSIGYADEPMYDETQYAQAVADKIGSKHTVFKLGNDDLYDHLFAILDSIDEPFADSSAIAVYILSKKTRERVTVALSGDGADEIFSGYNKHEAAFRVRQGGLLNTTVKAGGPLWKMLPHSRGSKLGNVARQLDRFATGMRMSAQDRYWKWASFYDENAASQLVLTPPSDNYRKRKQNILQHLTPNGDLNEVLYTDTQLVLPNDMLTKVDLMSMANSLEVRTPFLDHHVVEFAFSLPVAYKIDAGMRKKILQDAYRDQLPEVIYKRPKHGFEVPLVKWFQGKLRPLIEDDLLADDFIEKQGIFNPEAIQKLKAALFSKNTGDSALTIWALIVFQYWWKKHIGFGDS